MKNNTKILLGLGLIGLAYYLWQKSNKPKGSSSKPLEIKAGNYKLKDNVGGVVMNGPTLIEYNFNAGDIIEARPMNVKKGWERIVILKTTPDGKMPCEGFECIGQVWVDIPLNLVENV